MRNIKTLKEIKQKLGEHKNVLQQKFKINRLGIFGSFVRGEQHQDSDLDVLIDYDDAPSLLTLIDMEFYLSDITGLKVDLVTTKGLKPQLKNNIIKEVVYI